MRTCAGSRCADFVILNKMDQLASEEQKDSLTAIVSALNPLAKVFMACPALLLCTPHQSLLHIAVSIRHDLWMHVCIRHEA